MIVLLFPCDYMDDEIVDAQFKEEYEAAKQVGLQPVLYDYDAWFEAGYLDVKETFETPVKAILRGWKMMPSMYQRLFEECLKQNIELINTPEEYETLEVFHKVYPKIEKGTLPIQVFEKDVLLSDVAFDQWTISGLIDQENPSFFPEVFNKETEEEKWKQSLELYHSIYGREVCIQEYKEPWIQQHFPILYRVFYVGNKIVSITEISNQVTQQKPSMDWVHQFKDLSSFYYLDCLLLKDGTWSISSCGDGQVGVLTYQQDVLSFYKEIQNALDV